MSKTKLMERSAKKLAVVYARVSSRELARKGYSVPTQLKLLRDYAANHGFEIIGEFVDVHPAKDPSRNFDAIAGTAQEQLVRNLQNAMECSYSAACAEAVRKGMRKKSKAGTRPVQRRRSR